MKARGTAGGDHGYAPIELPRNSPAGFLFAFAATFFGFAMIWHIWWLAILGAIGALGIWLALAWRTDTEDEVSPAEMSEFYALRELRA